MQLDAKAKADLHNLLSNYLQDELFLGINLVNVLSLKSLEFTYDIYSDANINRAVYSPLSFRFDSLNGHIIATNPLEYKQAENYSAPGKISIKPEYSDYIDLQTAITLESRFNQVVSTLPEQLLIATFGLSGKITVYSPIHLIFSKQSSEDSKTSDFCSVINPQDFNYSICSPTV